MAQWLDVLNNEQRAAVENTEGYLCLHAGAGTGKTKTLTYRYAYLISEYGISPRSVWCVTFTNKAANEMKERVKALCGSTVGNPFITTFHGFCASFLREEIMAIGWPKTFSIADVNDVKEILRPLYHELDIKGNELSLRKAWSYIDETKEGKLYIQDFIGPNTTSMLQRAQDKDSEPQVRLFWRYLFAQRTTYTLDFDDLILLTLYILKAFPEVRARWQERLEYILVDEFQDIDRDQYELVEILAGYNQNLFIVGDPDQTIYSFRGARVEFFKGFTAAHADEGGQQLYLTKNYRSHGNILQAAYSVISNNSDPDRRPLIPMRTDITLDDMVEVVDPDYQEPDRIDTDIATQIQSKSYIGQERAKSYKIAHAPEQTLYYDPTQDQDYASPFGDDDFSRFFDDDEDSDVIPDEFENRTIEPLQDRIKPTIGFKKEAKLRRVGINYDEPDAVGIADTEQSSALVDVSDAHSSPYSAEALSQEESPSAQMGLGEITTGGNAVDADNGSDYERPYFPPIGTATTMGRGRYGNQTAAKDRYRGNKPKPVHSDKPIVAHASDSFIEAKFVGRTIKDIQSRDPNASIAVLYRSHFIALILEQELTARKIVYNMVGDLSFFDRKEIRDVIAYMRLRVNLDDDVAFRRIVNVPPRRFGKKRIERLEAIAQQKHCSLFRALSYGISDPFLNPSGNMSTFLNMMSSVAEAPFRSPSDDLEIILSSSGYDEYLKASGEDERIEKIGSLRNYLSDFKKNHDDDVNLADFIAQISLMNSSDSTGETSPVSLMTVHNAKGLEFDYVFVISLNESIFPTKNSINEQNIAEERRLMYVAMTRACKQLIMVEAGGALLNRAKKERISREPSRFIEELADTDFVRLGTVRRKESKAGNQNAVTQSFYNPNILAVGERFHHKILGYGQVLEVRAVEGEYLVYYEKLRKQRTLSFSHSDKIERLGIADGVDAAKPFTPAAAAQQSYAPAPVQQTYTPVAAHQSYAPAAELQTYAPVAAQQSYVPGSSVDAADVTNPYASPAANAYVPHAAQMQSATSYLAPQPYAAQPRTAYEAQAAQPFSVEQQSAYDAYGDDDSDNSMSVEQFLNSSPVEPLSRSGNPYGNEASPYGASINPHTAAQGNFASEVKPNAVQDAYASHQGAHVTDSNAYTTEVTVSAKQESDVPSPTDIVLEMRAFRTSHSAKRQQQSHAEQHNATQYPAAKEQSPYDSAAPQSVQQYAKAVEQSPYASAEPQSVQQYATAVEQTPYDSAAPQAYRPYADTAEDSAPAYARYQPLQSQEEYQATGGYHPQPRVTTYEKATEKFKSAGYSSGLPTAFNLESDDIEDED